MYYITIWRPRNYYSDRLLATKISVFDFELFIGGGSENKKELINSLKPISTQPRNAFQLIMLRYPLAAPFQVPQDV